MSEQVARDPVLIARRRLTAAMHAMHADQRIIVNEGLAQELDAAWDAYDAAIRSATVSASQ